MTQQRLRVGKKQYLDQNILNISIEITCFFPGILQVGHILIGIYDN